VAERADARYMPRLRRVSLTSPHLPLAWDGLTILQVADVHAGLYMPARRMRRIRTAIADLGADLIVFTGDQLDRRPSEGELFAAGFKGVDAPLGVFGILGNHDHYFDPAVSIRALRQAGVTPLVNRSVTLHRGGSTLALIGLDDLLDSTLRGPDFSLLERHPGAFRICLCHQPQGWSQAAAAGAHLTLSGHTHGGQIALTTRRLNLARLHTRYVAGPYRREDSLLYVSRGIGVGAVPLRIRAPRELDLITLHRGSMACRAVA
jgi:predicted MPP superfamily phosphohydrolase